MDDAYEEPGPNIPPPALNAEGDDGESSAEEDMPDWTKLPTAAGSTRPVIPKRGEKDFEPAPGSNLQEYSLEKARHAMVDALKGTRGISSKSITYALWIPDLARARVFQSRGIHFNNMGHAVRRSVPTSSSDQPRTVTYLELLPEEALYLIERGSLMCYKSPVDSLSPGLPIIEPHTVDLSVSPMTVQQGFAEMIGREGLSLEKYECYAYLKRLGFIVTRAVAPSPSYPLPPPYDLSIHKRVPFRRKILLFISWIFSPSVIFPFQCQRNWLQPLWTKTIGRANSCDYSAIFRALRIIPSGHKNPLRSVQPVDTSTPYEVFYHLWKPNTSWKKTAPPPADFELVIVDGRTTPIPSLGEITSLFSTLPKIPPPLPRRRNPIPATPVGSTAPTTLRSILTFAWLQPQTQPPPLTPHPFAAIRAGNKNVIIGVVDAGTVSFMRFGEGVFDEWPMM